MTEVEIIIVELGDNNNSNNWSLYNTGTLHSKPAEKRDQATKASKGGINRKAIFIQKVTSSQGNGLLARDHVDTIYQMNQRHVTFTLNTIGSTTTKHPSPLPTHLECLRDHGCDYRWVQSVWLSAGW
jgi:hypothetical protein